MLLVLVIILLLLWGGGYGLAIGGDLIHFLLVLALIVLILSYLPAWRGRAD